MRALVVAAMLVACSDPPGVTLQVVRKDPAIKTVELFVGEECRTCPSAMAPPALRIRDTNIALVTDAAPFVGEWQGNSALFRLTSVRDPSQYVPLLIAVGFNDAHEAIAVSTLRDKFIPSTDAEHWKTVLKPAEPIVDPDPTDDNERIKVWRATPTARQCVMVEHGRYSSDTVVPDDDTDCDGLPASVECAPFAANGTNLPPSIDRANCVRPELGTGTGLGVMNTLCLLGGPACNETATTPAGCESLDLDYCVTSSTCSACDSSGWDCVANMWASLPSSATGVSKIGCAIPMTTTGGECVPAVQTDATLDLGMFLTGSNGGTKCKALQLAALGQPSALSDHVQVGNGTLTIKGIDDNCKAAVDWSGPYGHAPAQEVVIADITLDNHKHMVMPLFFNPGDCGRAMTCSGAPGLGDTMLLCNQEAKDTTTCGMATACPNNLTACGGRCCGPGEACSNGMCVCGDSPHCVASDCVSDPNGGAPMPGACGTICCSANNKLPGCP